MALDILTRLMVLSSSPVLNPTTIKCGPNLRSRVCYGKPMRAGEFLPQPLAACGQAGGSPGATSPPGESTSTGGQQQGGSSSSSNSGSGGRGRDGANSSSTRFGGGDDSDDGDDGGGGKKRLQPIGRSHSLETPEPYSAAAASPSTGASTPAGAIAPASSLSESSCSAHVLSSEGTHSNISSSEGNASEQPSQPALAAAAAASGNRDRARSWHTRVSPFAATAAAAPEARTQPSTAFPAAVAAATAAAAAVAAPPTPAAPAGQPAASGAAGSGPWRLHSPFAAAQLNDAAAAAAATDAGANDGSSSSSIESKTAAGRTQTQAAPHGDAPLQPAASSSLSSGPPRKLHSPFAMAQPPASSTAATASLLPGRAVGAAAPRSSSSSTSSGAGKSPSPQLPAPPPHPVSSPAVKPDKQASSSNMLKERMATVQRQHKAASAGTATTAHVQPHRLHSPFAAAAPPAPATAPSSDMGLVAAAGGGSDSSARVGLLVHELTISTSGISSLPAADSGSLASKSTSLSSAATGLPPAPRRGAWGSKVPPRHGLGTPTPTTTTATAGSAAAGRASPFAAVQQPHAASPAAAVMASGSSSSSRPAPSQAAAPAASMHHMVAARALPQQQLQAVSVPARPLAAPAAAVPRPFPEARQPAAVTSAFRSPGSAAAAPAVVGAAAGQAVWDGHIACALPAAVTEGVPTPQLDVLVVRPAASDAVAAGGTGALSYRVVAQIEGITVGQTREVSAAAGGEQLLSLALPPLPRGVLQLSIDWRGKLCSLAAVPILPPACAAEMAQLWADMLQQQVPAAMAGASAESSVSSQQLAAAWRTYQAVVGRVAGILALQPPPGLPAAGSKVAGSARPSGRAAAAAMATATLATTAAGPVPAALASAHQKSRFAQLVHLFAAHNMWSLMQLATDCFYGAGASARALYACKHTVPLAAAGAAAQAGGAIS